MAVSYISFADKSYINENANIASTNKIEAANVNDIKAVVNNNASELSSAIAEVNDLTPVVLYQDSTGTTGNVSLSDSSANYSFIEIIYRKSLHEMCGSIKIDMSDGYGSLTGMIDYSSASIFQIEAENISISGSTITRGTARYINFLYSNNTFVSGTETGFTIFKVIGYK